MEMKSEKVEAMDGNNAIIDVGDGSGLLGPDSPSARNGMDLAQKHLQIDANGEDSLVYVQEEAKDEHEATGMVQSGNKDAHDTESTLHAKHGQDNIQGGLNSKRDVRDGDGDVQDVLYSTQFAQVQEASHQVDNPLANLKKEQEQFFLTDYIQENIHDGDLRDQEDVHSPAYINHEIVRENNDLNYDQEGVYLSGNIEREIVQEDDLNLKALAAQEVVHSPGKNYEEIVKKVEASYSNHQEIVQKDNHLFSKDQEIVQKVDTSYSNNQEIFQKDDGLNLKDQEIVQKDDCLNSKDLDEIHSPEKYTHENLQEDVDLNSNAVIEKGGAHSSTQEIIEKEDDLSSNALIGQNILHTTKNVIESEDSSKIAKLNSGDIDSSISNEIPEASNDDFGDFDSKPANDDFGDFDSKPANDDFEDFDSTPAYNDFGDFGAPVAAIPAVQTTLTTPQFTTPESDVENESRLDKLMDFDLLDPCIEYYNIIKSTFTLGPLKERERMEIKSDIWDAMKQSMITPDVNDVFRWRKSNIRQSFIAALSSQESPVLPLSPPNNSDPDLNKYSLPLPLQIDVNSQDPRDAELQMAKRLVDIPSSDLALKTPEQLQQLIAQLQEYNGKIQQQTDYYLDAREQLVIESEMHNKMIASLVQYAQQQQEDSSKGDFLVTIVGKGRKTSDFPWKK